MMDHANDSVNITNHFAVLDPPHSPSSLFYYYYESYDDKWTYAKDLIIFGLYLFTVILSLFGNAVVCYVAFVYRPKSTTYLFIGNMAASDLLSAVVIPLQWIFCSTPFLDANERPCGSLKSLQVVSYYISTFTMALIAIDRYLILRNPLARRVKPWPSIAIIWLSSFVMNIPTLFVMRVSEFFTATRMVHCRIVFRLDPATSKLIRKYRVSVLVMMQYVIPLLIATIFYTLCIRKILTRRRIGECTGQQQELKFYRSKLRTIKMLMISLLAFALGWLPVHLMHLIDFYIYPMLPKQCNSSFAYNFVYWLSISSIFYNPLIYCWFDRKFRSTVKLFCCCIFGGRCCCTMPIDTRSSTRKRYSITSGCGSSHASVGIIENRLHLASSIVPD